MRKIYLFVVFLILIFPSVIYELTSIHFFTSPPSLRYQWLNSPLSLVYFISFPFFFIADKYYSKNLIYLLVGIFFWDLLFTNFYAYNNNYYESYINFFFGIILSQVFIKLLKYDFKIINDILEKIILANAAITILSWFLGFAIDYNHASVLRLNFPFLSSNETGFLCGVGILLALINKKQKNILIYVLVLFLTGSRGPVVFLILAYLLFQFRKHYLNIFKLFSLKYFLLAIILLTTYFLFFDSLSDLRAISGLFDLFNNLTTLDFEDDSFSGRILSIFYGWKLILQYPMGLSFCFSDVQINMDSLGYPTFPHSTLLYIYLTMGPLICFYLSYNFLKSYRLDRLLNVPIFTYIFLYLILSGGAIVNFKFIFFISVFYYLNKIYNESINNIAQL